MNPPIKGGRSERPKNEWMIDERPEMRIISDDVWEKACLRWRAIQGTHPRKTGQRGFFSDQKSYVKTNPPHLLSGSLGCGVCGGSISLVSGKGGGYYGCLNASRKSCSNHVLVNRKRIEKHFIKALYEKVLKVETVKIVLDKTAQKVREHFAHVPEEIRLKKVELNQTETRIHHLIQFISEGKAMSSVSSIATALEQDETKAKILKADVEVLERAQRSAFEPPPVEWIKSQLSKLHELLQKRVEASALLVRKLTGRIVLTPKIPEVGRPYCHAKSKLKSFALLDDPDEPSGSGSNSLQWWRRWESNPRPKVFVLPIFMFSFSFNLNEESSEKRDNSSSSLRY